MLPLHALSMTIAMKTRPCTTSGSFGLEVRKRHPLFAKCQAQVSLLGEGKSLVFLGNLGTDSYWSSVTVRHRTPLDCHLRIPAGWWWTAISTQPSVTLHHTYWSFENRHCENHWDPPFFTSRKKKKTKTHAQQLDTLGGFGVMMRVM